LETQGLDHDTMLVYWPTLPIGPIPASPDRIEVAKARRLILEELLFDFPWNTEADKANALGMLLTSYLRPNGKFLSPLFIIDAPKSGSGKTYLARILQETVGALFRSWVNNEEEIRKALTTALMGDDVVIILDDVDKADTVKSATLASALTKRQWDDRVLGANKAFRGENNRVWALTGNNIKLGGDIPTRSVLVRLNPGQIDPKSRPVSEFQLGDLDIWIGQEENRVRVIRALLTLIMAWADHGAVESTVHHRFGKWANIIGGVLEFHQVGGFLDNQSQVEEHVYHDEHLADFYARWYELYRDEPQQVSKIRESLGKNPEMDGALAVWKNTFPRNRRQQLVSARGLASLLRDAIGQDHGGFQVDIKPDGHGHDLYYVSPVL